MNEAANSLLSGLADGLLDTVICPTAVNDRRCCWTSRCSWLSNHLFDQAELCVARAASATGDLPVLDSVVEGLRVLSLMTFNIHSAGLSSGRHAGAPLFSKYSMNVAAFCPMSPKYTVSPWLLSNNRRSNIRNSWEDG